MNKKNIILIGGGGHCKSCIDVIEREKKFKIIGIIDSKEKLGQKILNYPIIGTDSDIEEIAKKCDYFLITLGQIMSSQSRIKLFKKVKELGKCMPTIISPTSTVSNHTNIGEGTIIMHNAVINALSTIGQNCIINTGALIEHDSFIKDHCHISTKATINGKCTINNGTFIGSGAIINHGLEIANNCIIGSGTVVIKSITDENTTWYGNPAIKK